MKLSIAILFFSLSTFQASAQAQWIPLESGTTKDLIEVYFPSVNTGYALGQNIILRTVNAGMTWSTLPLGIAEGVKLKNLLFLNDRVGFLGGTLPDNFEKIYKTTDMGATWIEISPDSAISGWSYNLPLYFSSEQTGMVFSNNNMWKTTDGGMTWAKKELPIYECKTISFIDSLTGLVGGWDGSFAYRGVLLKTTDGGDTWSEYTLPTSFGAKNIIGSVNLLNKDTGFAATNWGKFLQTTDGGITWNTDSIQKINQPSSLLDTEHRMIMLNSNKGYWLSENEFYYTIDSGKSWIVDFTDPKFLSSFTATRDAIYVVGQGGTILKNNIITSVLKEDRILQEEISVYPQPLRHTATISFTNEFKELYTLTIFDQAGKLILETTTTNATINLKWKDFTSGIYFFHITNDHEIIGSGKLRVE